MSEKGKALLMVIAGLMTTLACAIATHDAYSVYKQEKAKSKEPKAIEES